jgi:hypothetical protein
MRHVWVPCCLQSFELEPRLPTDGPEFLRLYPTSPYDVATPPPAYSPGSSPTIQVQQIPRLYFPRLAHHHSQSTFNDQAGVKAIMDRVGTPNQCSSTMRHRTQVPNPSNASQVNTPSPYNLYHNTTFPLRDREFDPWRQDHGLSFRERVRA